MSKKMILALVLSLIGIIGSATILYIVFSKNKNERIVWQDYKIGETSIKVQIADTIKTRMEGLSGRGELANDEGMLFIFPYSGKHGFWMKDMNFNLDIIWIKENKIAGISENVKKPETNSFSELETIYPPENVDSVLEVNSEFSKANNLKVGDSAKLVK